MTPETLPRPPRTPFPFNVAAAMRYCQGMAGYAVRLADHRYVVVERDALRGVLSVRLSNSQFEAVTSFRGKTVEATKCDLVCVAATCEEAITFHSEALARAFLRDSRECIRWLSGLRHTSSLRRVGLLTGDPRARTHVMRAVMMRSGSLRVCGVCGATWTGVSHEDLTCPREGCMGSIL